jgi:hypothetical protein
MSAQTRARSVKSETVMHRARSRHSGRLYRLAKLALKNALHLKPALDQRTRRRLDEIDKLLGFL